MEMTQKVGKRTLMGWLAIYIALILAAVGMMVVFSKNDPAHAAADKFVVLKRDSWSATRTYAAPNTVGVGTHLETYVGTISTDYLFWPDGSDVNKIAVASVMFCYHRTAGSGTLFQGMDANPDYTDDNDHLAVGTLALDNNGTGDRCKTYVIPDTFRVWFRMGQDPAWTATGKLRIQFGPDQDYDYKWGGANTKYFHPGDDPEVGEWHYCDCNYGGGQH